MATINFLYRSSKDKAFLKIRLFYPLNGKKQFQEADTKILVTSDYWKNNHTNTKLRDITLKNLQTDINTSINEIDNYLTDAMLLIDVTKTSKDWLKNQMDLFYNPKKEEEENEALPTEILKYFDFFMDCKQNEIAKGTKKKYNVTKHLLERYQASKKTTLQIIDINYKFKVDFEKYCLKNNYALNTISKDLRTIKTVCNHAKQNGIVTSHQLDSIKTPLYKTEKIYLSFEDIEKIENIDVRRLDDNLDNAKDWLIISCFTSQRFSDFMRFDKSMIRYEKNKKGISKPFIEFTQIKTDKRMVIALHPKVIEILNKRNGDFPKVISGPKYNLFIKQVCRIAGITDVIKGSVLININNNKIKQYRKESGMFPKWQLVTSHIGRRSFATNFYGTIPTTYLINVTGHSTEAMFLNYIGKSNKDLAMELTNYF